jgi:hypothetical protein
LTFRELTFNHFSDVLTTYGLSDLLADEAAAARLAILGSSLLIAIFLAILLPFNWFNLPGYYLRNQDGLAGLGLVLLLLMIYAWQPTYRPVLAFPGKPLIYMLASALALLLWQGTHTIMLDYPLRAASDLNESFGIPKSPGK